MTSIEIQESVQKWELIRQDSVQLVSYLSQGDSFVYDFPSYAQTSESLHAYPAIYDEKLYFLMVPSAYDKQEYMPVIDQYTTACLVQRVVGSGEDRIPSAQAQARMAAWDNYYAAWVPEQVNGAYGIFEAFKIPAQDFEVETVYVNLGLELNAAAIGGFKADLIIINDDGKQIVYDDFVNAVPPFDAVPGTQEEFALLSSNI